MVFEVGIVLSKVLDFLDEIVLVCFGMRLVDASKFAGSTSTANIWSDPITLHKKKQARRLAFAQWKTYTLFTCPVVQALSGSVLRSFRTFCLANLH